MLKITELFPNPEGQDGNKEWIEITNFSQKPINLKDYALDDIEGGGSKPYTIPSDIQIQPNQSIVFNKSETGINLNNTEDTVRLISPNNETIQEVTYTTPPTSSILFTNNNTI